MAPAGLRGRMQAVILCGPGASLYPLVEPLPIDDDGMPVNDPKILLRRQVKALLPVGNRTSIDYVFDLIDEANLAHVLVLASESESQPISHHLRNTRKAGLTVRSVANAVASASTASATGTATAENESIAVAMMSSGTILQNVPESVFREGATHTLLWARQCGLIQRDFVLLPCDLLLAPAHLAPTNNSAPAKQQKNARGSSNNQKAGSSSTASSQSANLPWLPAKGAVSNPITLSSLIDRHVSHNALVTSLMYEREAGAVLPARKNGPPEVLTVTDSPEPNLVDMVELDDIADDDEATLSRILANQASFEGNARILTTNLLPTQIYMLSERIWPMIEDPVHARRVSRIDSLVDLIGWICREHEQIKLKAARYEANQKRLEHFEKETKKWQLISSAASQDGASLASTMNNLSLSDSAADDSEPAASIVTSQLSQSAKKSSAVTRSYVEETRDSLFQSLRPDSYDSCRIVVWTKQHGWCGRSNSVNGLIAQNRAALQHGLIDMSGGSTVSSTWAPTAQVSADSWVHPTVSLGDKVSIKRSFIGKNTSIGKGCRIQGSLIMDNASIRENVKLDNCVVSSQVSIQDRSSLNAVELGAYVQLPPDTTLKSEQIVEAE